MKKLLALSGAILLCAAAPVLARTYGRDGWNLSVRTDHFTRQTRCTLTHHPFLGATIVVGEGVADFRFDPNLDVSEAWFAVDNQPARPWRDLIAKLVAAGAMARAERLDNPTAGVVRLPLDEIGGASTIAIQPAPHARPRRFSLKGLARMLQQAKELGCPS